MLILRDFKCSKCGREFEDLVAPKELSVGCTGCKSKAYFVVKKMAVHGCDSFNPHYDEQIGQYFESADHKKKVLRSLGREQLSGPLSPRKSNKSSIHCNFKQAKTLDHKLTARMPKTV